MKLRNVKIGTQLRLGFGVVLLLVVGLGAMVWSQVNRLGSHSLTMYEQALQVGAAAGEIEADILAMHGGMQHLLLEPGDAAITRALQDIATRRLDAEQRLALLGQRYQGPAADITGLRDEFAGWNVSREETLRLLRAGKTAEATERTLHGEDFRQMGVLVRQVHQVEIFARNTGNQLYQTLLQQGSALKERLAVMFAVVLWLCTVVGGLLLKGIKTPLKALGVATRQFRQGHLDTRCAYRSTNEFGVLATAFNTMADEIQSETGINDKASQLAEVMLGQEEVQAFCRESLTALVCHTGSQVGAIYFLNEARNSFVHFESIGLGADKRTAFSATDMEGELGVVLASRQIQRITRIPSDTRMVCAAVCGDFLPREILSIPVVSDDAVVAVISLASIHAYDEAAVSLVQKIWSVLTARVNGVLAFRRIHYFAEQLAQKNQELEAQQRELAVQTDELTEQNTELEMQKGQLQEASRLKSAFLSNMSHELRTPLNSVIALAGVLNRRIAHLVPAEEHGYLEVIERNGKNLLSLINDILDLSRIEAGREEINLSRFPVREWVGEVVAMISPQAREKNLTLRNLVAADLPTLTSDADKCRHILQNLVSNAVKFTESGTVEISARQTPAMLLIEVRDTGIGIAADQVGHIFDEFRQADDSTARKYGGTGLGLAIARHYAKLLDGAITVDSTPGHGSTFTLSLPLVADSGSRPAGTFAHPGAVPVSGAAPSGRGKTILVVEDNEPAIIQLTDILHAQGYHVQVAHDGLAALKLIDQAVPDAMILDLMMPGVDGFQVLRTIRREQRTAQVPVLVLTAKHVTRQELSFLTGNHIHQLIQKGDINKDGLLAAVARMVAPPPAPPPAAAPRRRGRLTRPGKPLILVVEDNPDNLRTARALLGGDYRVITAEDGQGGLEQARLHQPDLILMDIALPVLDGFAALAALRQDDALAQIPVLAVTASVMKGDREQILSHGFDGYISKPIDHAVLMDSLREFLVADEET